MSASVLQEWVCGLTWRQQTVLLAAIRGPDGTDKYDFARALVRQLRTVVLKDAAPGNGFMLDHWPNEHDIHDRFLKRPDAYPLHWLIHFMHAVEIVGYEHPVNSERWRNLYYQMADMLHLNPESPEQMRARLQDGGARGCWKT